MLASLMSLEFNFKLRFPELLPGASSMKWGPWSHLSFSVVSGPQDLATVCAVTLRPVYMLSSSRWPLPALSSWKTLTHPSRPSISDLSLSLQNLMGVGDLACLYM